MPVNEGHGYVNFVNVNVANIVDLANIVIFVKFVSIVIPAVIINYARLILQEIAPILSSKELKHHQGI